MSEDILPQLSRDEKASLTAGRDIWHLPGIPRVGILPLKMSDGPSGVRGERFNTRRSLSFACGMAAGATWDVELIGRYGRALAGEAQSKGVHLLLGPTICIPRTPLAGRTFESLSEDPHLTSRLTVAYVSGVQDAGVGACVKHFACNDQEHERMSISAEVDERTLREVHLPAFEAAVREAGVWAVMSAYNKVNGIYCGEQPELLGRILKQEWGFDGIVVSDWFGAHSTEDAARAGLDIEMPGPGRHLGPRLAAAVDDGRLEEAVLDDHASRVLRLVERTGALGGEEASDEAEEDDADRRRVARELALGGSVLLRNQGVLPLDPAGLRRVAVIGPHGDRLETGGGGSSSVTPLVDRSPVDELRARLDGVDVTYEPGCRLDEGNSIMNPRLLNGGLSLTYFAASGDTQPVGQETCYQSRYTSFGDPLPGVSVATFALRAEGTFTPAEGGEWKIGMANTGDARLLIDGTVVVDNSGLPVGSTFYGIGCDPQFSAMDLEAGRDYHLTVELDGNGTPAAGFELYATAPENPGERERAVQAARDADVAIVVVGANPQAETEGYDRADLRLLGDQDELISAVADVNANTIVVLNAGSPVEMPWADEVTAILNLWYPGEEGASALADMLVGEAEPGGRLPITFPRQLSDGPTSTPESYPGVDGTVLYTEGLLVGYRHFDHHEVEPLFPFGHGLSYTTFEYGDVTIEGDVPTITIRVPVTNTGPRAGSEVVQAYVGYADRDAQRPLRQLGGFAKVRIDAAETVAVEVALDERAFSRWDADAQTWVIDPGRYDIEVGSSSRDLRVHRSVTVSVH